MVGPLSKGKATCRHDLNVKSSSQSSLLTEGKAGSQTTVKLSEISNSAVMSSAPGAFDGHYILFFYEQVGKRKYFSGHSQMRRLCEISLWYS